MPDHVASYPSLHCLPVTLLRVSGKNGLKEQICRANYFFKSRPLLEGLCSSG